MIKKSFCRYSQAQIPAGSIVQKSLMEFSDGKIVLLVVKAANRYLLSAQLAVQLAKGCQAH